MCLQQRLMQPFRMYIELGPEWFSRKMRLRKQDACSMRYFCHLCNPSNDKAQDKRMRSNTGYVIVANQLYTRNTFLRAQ